MTPLTFDIASRVLVALAIAMLVVPLIRHRGATRVWPAATAAALFVYLGSALAYPYLSNWEWNAQPAAPAVTASDTQTLREAASQAPHDPQAQAAYALSLLQAGRTAESVEPLERVYLLTDGANPDFSMLLVDALMAAGESRRDEVNELVEKILMRAPDHPKALFYGAELAFSRGEHDLARTRWQKLLVRAQQEDSDDARRVEGVLQRRLASLDGAGAAPAPPASAPMPAPDTGAEGPRVVVEVSVDPALVGRYPPDAALFVLARAGDGAGPPVAVVRRSAGELPLSVTLSDAQAMLPTRKLSQFESVEIVARIARGGGPVAQPGDLFGSASARPDGDGPVSIQIDRVQQ